MQDPKPMVHQLIYVSAAKDDMPPAELAGLLFKARGHNKSVGLSGMLVHQAGSFFQILEGDEAAVEALFARITKDPRHHRVLVLSRKSVPAPAFVDWSMGFVEGSQRGLTAVAGFNDFFRKGFEQAQISADPGRAKELALAFRDGRFRQFVDV
jgi:hypothetical protein